MRKATGGPQARSAADFVHSPPLCAPGDQKSGLDGPKSGHIMRKVHGSDCCYWRARPCPAGDPYKVSGSDRCDQRGRGSSAGSGYGAGVGAPCLADSCSRRRWADSTLRASQMPVNHSAVKITPRTYIAGIITPEAITRSCSTEPAYSAQGISGRRPAAADALAGTVRAVGRAGPEVRVAACQARPGIRRGRGRSRRRVRRGRRRPRRRCLARPSRRRWLRPARQGRRRLRRLAPRRRGRRGRRRAGRRSAR
jgi:hypothetical protein